MSASLTLLSTYYIRESFLKQPTRRAIMLLKAWKFHLLRRRMVSHFVKSITIEMLCVYSRKLLIKQKKQHKLKCSITLLDIVQQVLALIIFIGDEASKSRPCMIIWPYQKCPDETLITKRDVKNWTELQQTIDLNNVLIMDNIILQNVERDLSSTQWKDVAYAAKSAADELMGMNPNRWINSLLYRSDGNYDEEDKRLEEKIKSEEQDSNLNTNEEIDDNDNDKDTAESDLDPYKAYRQVPKMAIIHCFSQTKHMLSCDQIETKWTKIASRYFPPSRLCFNSEDITQNITEFEKKKLVEKRECG